MAVDQRKQEPIAAAKKRKAGWHGLFHLAILFSNLFHSAPCTLDLAPCTLHPTILRAVIRPPRLSVARVGLCFSKRGQPNDDIHDTRLASLPTVSSRILQSGGPAIQHASNAQQGTARNPFPMARCSPKHVTPSWGAARSLWLAGLAGLLSGHVTLRWALWVLAVGLSRLALKNTWELRDRSSQ